MYFGGPNQSILKEISPEYSLERLMLMLKLQYFGRLMWRTDSFEKNLMLGKIEGRRRRGQQRMRWLDGITDAGTWVWVGSRSWWWTGRPGMLQSMGLQRFEHDWVTELNWTELTSRWLTHLYLLPWLLRYILEYSSWISLWYHTQKTSISERWTLGFCSPTYLCHLVASLPTTGLQWKAFIYCLYLNLPSSKSSNSDSKLCILSILKINSAIGLQRTLLTRSKKSNLYPFTQQPEWLFFFLMGKYFTCTKHL